MNRNLRNERRLRLSVLGTVSITIFALSLMVVPALAQEGTPEMNTLPNIVLVHGAWCMGGRLQLE